MRIESLNQVQQAYKATYANKAGNAANVAKTDNVQISSIGKDITVAKQAVREVPDIREDIVGPIKDKIMNGTYDVSADNLASRLLESFAGI